MPRLPDKKLDIPADAGFAITEFIGRNSTPARHQISVAIEDISKGVTKPRHYHNVSEEIFFVMNGAGFLTIDETEYPIRKGDAYLVEVGQRHNLRASEDQDLSVMLISSPAYEPSDYIKC